VIGAAAVSAAELEGAAIPVYDEGRLRRMDRFGRAGFLAGSLALRDAGHVAPADVDARVGVVLGSALGCRDANTRHAHLLASARHVEDLSPSLFTQTVHNSAAGELAIEWRIGGPSEVLVSGRAAGLEAILRAASLVGSGAADRVVAVGAEGLHPEMQAAWLEERARYGPRGAELPCADGGAAVVVAREGGAARARLHGGVVFFEPDEKRVAARLAAFVEGLTGGGGGTPALVLAAPALDAALEPAALEAAGLGALVVDGPSERELFGAAGPLAVVDVLRGARGGLSVVVVRDPEGPVAAVALELPATPRSG